MATPNPREYQTLPWLVDYHYIPANLFLTNRYIAFDSLCFRCGSSEESILHLLRDYPKAIHVWDLFQLDVHGNPPEDGVSIWIKKHATNISGSLFVATTWWVGKTRNKEVFRQTCIYSRSCPSQQNFIAPQYHSEGLLPFDFFSPC